MNRMRIALAGYNLDSTIIEQLKRSYDKPEALTPETVAVAYARISRDPSPVTQLRQKAINDVESARRSARSIIFDMNHQSVAEHAIFNFDVLDVSRLCVEALEWHRLCSYTEKSQRYQELIGDHIMPEEFKGRAKSVFENSLKEQNELYEKAFPILLDHFKQKYPDMLSSSGDQRVVEGYAKEDARYATGLAATAQLGFTANARNLEYVIRCLKAHPLKEMRDLGDEFYRLAGAVAPSLILLTDPVEYEKEFGRPLSEDHFTKTHAYAREMAAELVERFGGNSEPGNVRYPTRGNVKLIGTSPDPDRTTLQVILHSHTSAPAETCAILADRLLENRNDGERLIREFMRYSNPWEAATREFEAVDFTFEVVLSAACFGQMKRHRMTTQLMQDYDPGLGYTYPPSVEETGLAEEFKRLYENTSATYNKLTEFHPLAAQYVLTNGHRRRMLVKVNAREIYHISRLREDIHAQWDIRQVASDMVELAREKAPITLLLAFGKDVFEEKKKEIFGKET